MTKRKKYSQAIKLKSNVEILPRIDFEMAIEGLTEGKTFKEIAAEQNIPTVTMFDFLYRDVECAARVRVALVKSAQMFADLAEEVIKNAPRDFIEIQRARELAQHYRWKASKRNPREFGDKIDITTQGEKLPATTIIWGDKKIQV